MKILRLLLLFFALPTVGVAALPGDSVYHINSRWVDQHGENVSIADFSGQVQVIAFVYTYCEHSCPIILARLKKLKTLLSNDQNGEVQFLLVSLDPQRDTPAVLSAYMQTHNLVSGDWNMLNGDPDDVLELAALVGVRYQPMDREGKDIAHSNMITVLDKHGVIAYQMKGLDEGLEGVVEILRKLSAQSALP